ncbi:hypothetical protein BDV32DRAFT_128750 [Aspergillus pseudonomiae]|uniref:Uncharacterized protein n=1 Tax=Aspergillus pseudonomiae TaxID=1506151 RepID=A0A5N6HQ32_9EURO|nr:uncharacterized protein BDV37DRAFT_245125 [Aspergillus pseudonomiae]KAB8256602.1 hypothetical protein BDV32DRAFT_128750 [Aspergillus pseudonomiae]KAE8405469.1 hypothetical protein BDV37DRAFT_245125 [Aspergillus pseudonomiae]
MPRGAEYDDGVPHSDNAVKAGQTKVHGAGDSVCARSYLQFSSIPLSSADRSEYLKLMVSDVQNAQMGRVFRTAEFPEAARELSGNATSFGGSAGHSSGKGGHEPKSLGEHKGLGAHKD